MCLLLGEHGLIDRDQVCVEWGEGGVGVPASPAALGAVCACLAPHILNAAAGHLGGGCVEHVGEQCVRWLPAVAATAAPPLLRCVHDFRRRQTDVSDGINFTAHADTACRGFQTQLHMLSVLCCLFVMVAGWGCGTGSERFTSRAAIHVVTAWNLLVGQSGCCCGAAWWV